MKKGIIKERWNKYRKKKRWWSIVLDFLFLVLIVAMLIPQSRKTVSAFMVRQTMLAPRESSKTILLTANDWQMPLRKAEGEIVRLSEFQDRPVFINYWATWCPPCLAEMPSIKNLYDKYKDSVHFVFITNEDEEVVLKFMDRHGYDFPVYSTAGFVPDALLTTTLPTTILLAKGGNIVLYKTGAARWNSKRAFKIMDDLLLEY